MTFSRQLPVVARLLSDRWKHYVACCHGDNDVCCRARGDDICVRVHGDDGACCHGGGRVHGDDDGCGHGNHGGVDHDPDDMTKNVAVYCPFCTVVPESHD